MKPILSVAVIALLASGAACTQSGSTGPSGTLGTPQAAANPDTTSGETLPPTGQGSGSSVPGDSVRSGAVGAGGTSSSTNPPGSTGQQAPGSRATGSTTGAAGGQ
jgi:hypothetical protein